MTERKLSRKLKHRRQMLKNLAGAVIIYEKIKTTQTKAKAVIPIIEQIIKIGKNKDLTSRKKLLSFLNNNKNVVNKIIKEISPRFKDQKTGFLKIYKIPSRLGDNSKMATIILAKSKFLGNLPEPKDKNIDLDKKAPNEINKTKNS